MKVILEIPNSDTTVVDDLFSDAIIYVIRKQLDATAKAESKAESDRMIAYYGRKIDAYEAMQQSVVIEK